MMDFESARECFVESAGSLAPENLDVTRALNRVLAAPVVADRDIPEFDTSAMDGYAIRIEDLGALPHTFDVLGEAPAGSPPNVLRAGTAMRIFTGAALPEGANAVLMQEHVERIGSTIVVQKPVRPRENVRNRGEDLRRGSIALNAGERLNASSLGLVHFLDRVLVAVAGSPVVSIVATGSELRAPGSVARPGSIVESNSPMIAALTTQVGATVLRCSRVDDEAAAIQQAIEAGLEASDVLVTIGGVSVGDYDLVKPALLASGVELTLHHVSIKPGKPITLGRRKDKIVIGLPGNPASAVLTYALFALPLLRKMQGDRRPFPTPVMVPATISMKRDPKRTRIVLGNLEGFGAMYGFVPHLNQSSGAMTALAQSTAMVLLSSGGPPVEVGELVPLLRWTDL